MSSTLKSRGPKESAPKASPVVAPYQASVPSHHYEFGGPIGALFVTLSVPFFTYWLSLACTPSSGCPPWPLNAFASFHRDGFAAIIGGKDWWNGLWSGEAALVYLGWYAFCLVCWAVLPGKMVEGVVLRNGERIKYPMNGSSSFSHTSAIADEGNSIRNFCSCDAHRRWSHGRSRTWSAVVYHRSLDRAYQR